MLQFILKEFFSNRRQLNSINSHVQSWVEIIIHLVKESFLSLEGLMLKLKLNTFASLREELTPKDPDAGKDWRREQKGTTEDEMVGWHHWLNGHEFEKLWEIEKDREAWHATIHGVPKSQTWLSNWTTTTEEIRMEVDRGSGKWEQFCGSCSGPNIRPKWQGWEEEGPGSSWA